MKIYLAGNTIFPKYIAPILTWGDFDEVDESVFSRGSPCRDGLGYDPIIKEHRPYILESFYYADAGTERLIPYFGDFMLDSGAFTFMQNAKKSVKWEEYIEEYADFVKRNKIKKYFELDIDSVVGYDRVKKYREKLEKLVGWQSIPVWHISRGTDEFIRMSDEYNYVALGGIVSGEWSKKSETLMPWFIKEAHKRNAKIHGLGYTKLANLKHYHFDSVDSTAWTTGNRFGYIYQFKNGKMQKIDAPKGKRLKDGRKVALINYTEWIKFQKWAEAHL